MAQRDHSSDFVVDNLEVWDAKIEFLRACGSLPPAPGMRGEKLFVSIEPCGLDLSTPSNVSDSSTPWTEKNESMCHAPH